MTASPSCLLQEIGTYSTEQPNEFECKLFLSVRSGVEAGVEGDGGVVRCSRDSQFLH